MSSFTAIFRGVLLGLRTPPWSNEPVRWPVQWAAWFVVICGALAVGAMMAATIIEGIPREHAWFALKTIVVGSYLTLLAAYVGVNKRAPAGWLPWPLWQPVPRRSEPTEG